MKSAFIMVMENGAGAVFTEPGAVQKIQEQTAAIIEADYICESVKGGGLIIMRELEIFVPKAILKALKEKPTVFLCALDETGNLCLPYGKFEITAERMDRLTAVLAASETVKG